MNNGNNNTKDIHNPLAINYNNNNSNENPYKLKDKIDEGNHAGSGPSFQNYLV
jgi:hypothetical protein